MKTAKPAVLLIGYGNPGRLDDGLGPALAAALESRDIPGLVVDSDYQLTVEDADAVAKHDVVIFADAHVNGTEPFSFTALEPNEQGPGFSSHSIEPEQLLALAQSLFQAGTKAYALAIRGYEFNEFGERLSQKARENLDQAISFIEGVIRNDLFDDAITI